MRYAVIGKGFIFPRHRKAIQDTFGKLELTCDIDWNKNPDYTDWRDMFDSKEFRKIDTVVICTPNYLHAEMVRLALAMKKNVICEKPLTIDNNFYGLDGVNTVLQLRYNKDVNNIRKNIEGVNNKINIIVKTYREKEYWNSWKGDPEKSGGILYNMGIHYLDLLVYILGDVLFINNVEITKTLAKGEVVFDKGLGTFHIELMTEPGETVREIIVNGKKIEIEGATIPLSERDNIRTDLHTEVYKHFLNSRGISLSEAKKSLLLAWELLENNGK